MGVQVELFTQVITPFVSSVKCRCRVGRLIPSVASGALPPFLVGDFARAQAILQAKVPPSGQDSPGATASESDDSGSDDVED